MCTSCRYLVRTTVDLHFEEHACANVRSRYTKFNRIEASYIRIVRILDVLVREIVYDQIVRPSK